MKQDYLDALFSTATRSASNASNEFKVEHVATAKTVTKGWGEERWLVNEKARFGFKIIHIKAGQRTSLQYHECKEEANLVLNGNGVLFYTEQQQMECLREIDLSAGDIVHILPGMVHRIEAENDITLVECSTPELDDVIRLEDDWNRSSGRIEYEHSTKAE
ncbi:cupin domain-containing protein [Mesorhizobium kowhaii]|uniref:cupin domain-containing protein n=1 Tax=Mesorhizobium kowhaii TaxID=1300272 RepID=UPI0035E82B97